MGEIGTVKKSEGRFLYIEMERKDECARCGACLSFSNDHTMRMKAFNECKAKVGDQVEIELTSDRFMAAVWFLYGIPLVFFGLGIVLGYLLHLSEPVTMLLALLVLGLSYLAIHLYTKRLNEARYTPHAVRIIEED